MDIIADWIAKRHPLDSRRMELLKLPQERGESMVQYSNRILDIADECDLNDITQQIMAMVFITHFGNLFPTSPILGKANSIFSSTTLPVSSFILLSTPWSMELIFFQKSPPVSGGAGSPPGLAMEALLVPLVTPGLLCMAGLVTVCLGFLPEVAAWCPVVLRLFLEDLLGATSSPSWLPPSVSRKTSFSFSVDM